MLDLRLSEHHTLSYSTTLMIRSASGLRVALILIGYIVPVSTGVLAQVPSPVALLDEVVARYQNTMEATFVHHLTSEAWDGSQTLTGTVQLWGDRYRVETLHEVITGQGEEVWIYRAADNQVLMTTVDRDGLAYSPGALFRSYGELYHPHASSREILDGVSYFRLELYPLEEDFAISSLTLWIREHDRMIKQIVALDQSSVRTEIELENIRVGLPIPPETFEFRAPEGAEVIDLRS